MFITEDFFPCRPGHHRALRAVHQRFRLWLRSPCPVCRYHRKMVIQRGAGPPTSRYRLRLFAVQFARHHLPFPVKTRLRVLRQGEPPSRPYLRRTACPACHFRIIAPAVHLPAGKILAMCIFETPGVVIHFILRALVIHIFTVLVKAPRPAGTFKGVILDDGL